MKLTYLKLENFQGIRDMSIFFDGHNASIYGDNGTGKTTVYNAITWLLFDRSSTGTKNYSPKTKNANGDEHYLDHSSEATFSQPDGTKITLKKTLKEVYKRKRGSASEEFDGHTVDYFINGVPVKEKDFTAAVNGWFGGDPERAKILTSPHYFSESFPWEKRRATLVEICGDISDEDIINGTDELSDLISILTVPGNPNARYSPDEYRKIASSRKSEINKQLATIPARIDEANKAIPVTPTETESELKNKLFGYELRLSELHALSQDETAGRLREESELNRQIAEVQAEISEKKTAYQNEANEQNQAIYSQIRLLQVSAVDALRKVSSGKNALSDLMRKKDRAELEREALLREYSEAAKVKWNESSEICPTCKQVLPEEQIAELKADFNRRRSAKLEDINRRGQSVSKTAIDEIARKITEAQKMLEDAEAEYRRINDEIAVLEQKITVIPAFETTPTSQELSIKLNDLIEKRNHPNTAVRLPCYDGEIATLDRAISEIRDAIASLHTAQMQRERIATLSADEKRLCAEFEELERGIYLCEEFTRRKVSALTERINSRFETVRFRLFVDQINGGLKEDCEVMIPTSDGRMVPYAYANNAARINAGIEIINTLSSHWNCSAPLVVDNAESVTALRSSDVQIIRLVVSEADKKLRTVIE